jgi:hypothetical protein
MPAVFVFLLNYPYRGSPCGFDQCVIRSHTRSETAKHFPAVTGNTMELFPLQVLFPLFGDAHIKFIFCTADESSQCAEEFRL